MMKIKRHATSLKKICTLICIPGTNTRQTVNIEKKRDNGLQKGMRSDRLADFESSSRGGCL